MRTARKLMVAAGVLLLAAFVEGAGPQFSSAWAATPAKVDGTADTWTPFLRPLGDIPMVIGVQNDADFLYLCFKTSNPFLKRQLLSTGLTVWANGKGNTNTNRGFGVRYPLVPKAKGDEEHRRVPPTPTPAEGSVSALVQPPPEFEFIGPNWDNRRRMEFGDEQPITAALGDDSGVMVLELRIPLKASEALPLAIGVTPGTPIGLELATMPAPKPPGKVWAENVGGHPSAARDEDAPEMPAPFILWALVTLATPPSPPAAK